MTFRRSSIFIAGADLNELKALSTAPHGEELGLQASRVGQELMNRIEDFPNPWWRPYMEPAWAAAWNWLCRPTPAWHVLQYPSSYPFPTLKAATRFAQAHSEPGRSVVIEYPDGRAPEPTTERSFLIVRLGRSGSEQGRTFHLARRG